MVEIIRSSRSLLDADWLLDDLRRGYVRGSGQPVEYPPRQHAIRLVSVDVRRLAGDPHVLVMAKIADGQASSGRCELVCRIGRLVVELYLPFGGGVADEEVGRIPYTEPAL